MAENLLRQLGAPITSKSRSESMQSNQPVRVDANVLQSTSKDSQQPPLPSGNTFAFIHDSTLPVSVRVRHSLCGLQCNPPSLGLTIILLVSLSCLTVDLNQLIL